VLHVESTCGIVECGSNMCSCLRSRPQVPTLYVFVPLACVLHCSWSQVQSHIMRGLLDYIERERQGEHYGIYASYDTGIQ
jgi:hypothetical protein